MVTITASSRETPYNPVSPTTDFPCMFPIFGRNIGEYPSTDIEVVVNGEPRTDFTVIATFSEGVSTDAVVRMNSGVTGSVIIRGKRTPRRTDQYANGAPLKIQDHNYSLNRQEAELQEVRRDTDRNTSGLKQEIADRKAADEAERQARIAADQTLSGRIDAEIIDRQNAIQAEVNARVAGDNALASAIANERSDRINDVTAERNARINADDQERTARIQADTNERNDRINADNAEINARIAGDRAVASLIGQAGPIEVPLYDSATALNLAVVKSTVNSVRTGSYSDPRIGGGALYYRKMAVEADALGDQTSNGGATRWGLATQPINVNMFGAIHGLEAGAVENQNLQAFQDAIDFMESRGGGFVECTSDFYRIRPGLKMKTGVYLRGSPSDRWYMPSTGASYSNAGTILLLVGSPADYVNVYGVTDQEPYGGVIDNPDATGVGNDAQYALTNFYNSDAVGATAATQKDVSFGVSIDTVRNAGLYGIRVMNSLSDGGINYTDTSSTDLGNNVDVGIFIRNAPGYVLEGVQTAGYFRIGGRVMILEVNINDANRPLIESTVEGGTERNCIFHGYRGIINRSTDCERVTAVTSDTVSFPWHDSHFWAQTGKFQVGGTQFTYTGLSFADDKLTFEGVSPDPTANSVSVGATILTGSSFGSAPTKFENCWAAGLSHQSAIPASRLGFDSPSTAIEISGNALRKTYFDNVHVFDNECLFFGFAAHDTFFSACHFEPLSAGTIAGGPRDLGKKARMIASNNGSSGWFGTYTLPVAYVNAIFDEFCEFSGDNSVDLFPALPRGTGSWASASLIGLFRPTDFRMMGKAPAWQVPFRQAYNQKTTIDDGKGTIFIPKGTHSGEVTINNNSAVSITPFTTGGIIAIWAKSSDAFPQGSHSGLVAFDVGTSPSMTKLTTNTSDFTVVSTNVTGTTGATGETTMGVIAGNIRLENRQGAAMTYGYMILASS